MDSQGVADNDATKPQSSNGTAESITLGYLSCPQTADKGYIGALLVTDERTRPLHFAYVAPVRPTGMQRLLYGGTLPVHVKIDVIATKLFSSGLGVVPTVMFVDAPDLIEARRVARWPVAHLIQSTPDPASLSTMRYDTGAYPDDASKVGRVIATLESSVNLLDPFSRLRDALKEALKGESI